MALEPGLDLHDWETRWQELQDLAAESPAEALPEIVRLTEQMLVERGYDLNGGEDIVRDLVGARELAAHAKREPRVRGMSPRRWRT